MLYTFLFILYANNKQNHFNTCIQISINFYQKQIDCNNLFSILKRHFHHRIKIVNFDDFKMGKVSLIRHFKQKISNYDSSITFIRSLNKNGNSSFFLFLFL